MDMPTVYIPNYSSSNPPPIITKRQIQKSIRIENIRKLVNKYKEIQSRQQMRRNKFYKICLYKKLSDGHTITNNEIKKWKELFIRLNNVSQYEHRSQICEIRKWLKFRRSECARKLNFYPGVRRLNF